MKVCQVALPRASVAVNTIQGTAGIRSLNEPLISNLAVGALVPIPIFPPRPYIQFPIES